MRPLLSGDTEIGVPNGIRKYVEAAAQGQGVRGAEVE